MERGKPTRDENGKFPAYAWPGGYPIIYYTQDGGQLCPACANGENGSEAKLEEEIPLNEKDPQWGITCSDIHWEGAPSQCDHCGKMIESAYGPIEGTYN